MKARLLFIILILQANISFGQSDDAYSIRLECGLKDEISKSIDIILTSLLDGDSQYVRPTISSIDRCSVLVDIYVNDSKDTMVDLVVFDITAPHNKMGGYDFEYSDCIVAEFDNRQIFIHDQMNIQKIFHVSEYTNIKKQDVCFRNGWSRYYRFKGGKLIFSPLIPPLIEETVPLFDIEIGDE